ncbi:flavodoxin domain-containing protein [Actinophytocola sp. NPDC049390]|uniref:flavodoxin domain-containing protein n=1 Tax=Actinophytocola sp. NPDC049390 TaxID=3363894 RepID=UPI0037BB07C3
MTNHIDRVLVGYAGTGGSTESIATFVAARLNARGLTADLWDLAERPSVEGYDAVVLGSRVRDGALLRAAENFVWHNADALRVRPVWLFSVGISPSLRGPVGHLLRDIVPTRIAELCELIGPRDYHAFAGVVSRQGAPLLARIVLRLCGGRYGDLRDWQAIETWTDSITAYLRGAVPA